MVRPRFVTINFFYAPFTLVQFKLQYSAVILNIFRRQEGCRCLAEVTVLIALNTVPSRSSRYNICCFLQPQKTAAWTASVWKGY